MLSDSNAIAWRQQRCRWCGPPRPPRPTAPARGPPGFTMMFLAGRLYWYGLVFRSVWRNIFGVNITFFVQISPQFPLMFWWGWIPISSNAKAQLLLRIAFVIVIYKGLFILFSIFELFRVWKFDLEISSREKNLQKFTVRKVRYVTQFKDYSSSSSLSCRRRPGNIIRPPVFSRFICCRNKKIYVVVHICRGGGTDFV